MISTYEEALTYIHSLPHLHSVNNLQAVRQVLTKLGNPQDQIKTIHVTGTNGKGSTCNYLTHLLVAAGYQVGTFMSPYVQKFNERIQLNGHNVSDEQILALTQIVQAAVNQIQMQDPDFYLVEFEFVCVMMWQLFAQQSVDYGIIEVGIGGQHDKTNVITPELSIITNVGLDHEQLIGPSLKDIAQEKAGIIKSQRPVIVGELLPETQTVIQEVAAAQAAPVYQLGRDFQYQQIKIDNWDHSQFQWSDGSQHFPVAIASCAQEQMRDAAIAIKAFTILQPHFSPLLIKKALQKTQLKARMQIIATDPPIILDGAHNLPAIEALLHNILKIAPNRRIVVLYAAMVDKDRNAILSVLQQAAAQIIVTSFEEPRAAQQSDYQNLSSTCRFIDPWPVAFGQAVNSLDSESLLLICGSLHFAGVILDLLS